MKKFRPIITRILVMTASGFLLIAIAGTYTPSPFQVTVQQDMHTSMDEPAESLLPEKAPGIKEKTVSLPAKIMNTLNRLARQSAEILSELDTDREEYYSPSLFQYNLMALYPEEQELSPDDETASQEERILRLLKHNLKPFYDFFRMSFHTNASDSYGGRMYEYLNRKDAEWTSALYRWLQASPEQAAAMLKHSAASVTGKYDPTNEKHDPSNPATWLIPSWKNVHFNFYDGDGKRTDLYSNAQEIASMASIYTWFDDWKDVDNFLRYADELWQLSHGYHVSIGAVYYCEGCVDPEDAVLEPEDESDGGLQGNDAIPVQEEVSGPPPETASEALENEQTQLPASVPAESQNGASDASQEPPVNGSEQNTGEALQTEPQQLIASPSELSDFSAEGISAGAAALQAAVPEIQLNSEGKYCPGHVDLTVTARIIGLSEHKNLYTIDKRGSVKTESWNGWSAYNKAYVERLNSQDWELKYNLSSIEPALGKPLTLTEINEYLKLLPADISRERKAVITYALHSVGKIPYYYGGKAQAPGYEGNSFATITSPDRKGRIISGLDCSGWVNWVYWSSLGKVPTNIGTSGLIHAGRAISRSQLQPGDIIVRLGTDSHVVMFLAWASDGNIIAIHETGGSANNVTVTIMDARWPYYRALLD